MPRAIRQKVRVKPGGIVEVKSPDLVPGSTVDVLVTEETPKEVVCLASLFGSAKGGFRSPEEADAYLRAEREAWDR